MALYVAGRGGNFALGYAGGVAALPVGATAPTLRPELVELALEATRREVERCHEAHLGTVMLHSLGGGTGSGLGTRLLEEFRDTFPSSLILAVSVLPITVGENPLQSYNSLLALSSLQELADGVVLYENDRLLAMAERVAGKVAVGSDPLAGGASLASMNAVIVRDLVPFLCPASPAMPFDLGSLLSSVCPMPTHRFVQAFSAELAAPCEPRQLLDSLGRTMPRVAKDSGSVLAAHAVVRGSQGQQASDANALGADLLDRMGGSVAWQALGLDMQPNAPALRSAPASTRISVLTNWKRSAQVIGSVVSQARQKYAARMFLHWYERYGFEPDVFAHAFEVLDDVVMNYKAA